MKRETGEARTRRAGGVEYELARRRVKNLNLHVRADGSVAVSVPLQTSLREADEFVAAHSVWIGQARERQRRRYRGLGIPCNARLDPGHLRQFCRLDDGAQQLLQAAYDRMGLSGRSYDRLLRVARTIADLAGEDVIGADAVAEAIQYRNLDRKYWQPDVSEL